VLAAITREGEEAMLLAAWSSQWLRQSAPDALLLIVPRHPQRFDEVASLVRAAGLTLARRSTWEQTPPPEALQAQVWLGDSMREMALYYATARVAVMGPSTFNFNDAAELSIAAGASLRVADMASGVAEVGALLRDPERLVQLSGHAVQFASQHRGAAARMARRIVPLMRPA
jgi:3-deoxy-D-manno-octulosonic-acid transferase